MARRPRSNATGVPTDPPRPIADPEPERAAYSTAVTELRKEVDGRLYGLRQQRMTWWAHWRDVAEHILPRRYHWLVTPNQAQRGSAINQRIIDETGTIAARICAAGMMAGITSPARPWFKLTIPDLDADGASPVKAWLDEVQNRMLRVFAESNYYTAKAVQYFDLVVFGTAPLIIYEDPEDVVRCYNPCAGEYYAANDSRLQVNTLYREMTMTVRQVVQEFGLDACSEGVKGSWRSGGAATTREVIVAHAMEPNETRQGGQMVPKRYPWREVYWELGTASNLVLRARGFHEAPFSCPRWDLSANDAYGRSPGMDALGAIKQLQLEQRRKAQLLDKLVNPPMTAAPELKNQPASTLPGGVTYVTQPTDGFKPAYQITAQGLPGITEDIKEVQERVGRIFFNDLFMMISNIDTVRTATEIDARREEKLIQLGPVLERFENESLDEDIERVFAIMLRRGLLPPSPQEIQGQPVQVNYISMLATAQRAASTTSIERLVAFVGNLAGADPQALDMIDFDEAISLYSDMLDCPPKVLRDMQAVLQMRAQRQQQQAQQQAMQNASAAVQGAQVLSQTPVGGGHSALTAMLSGGAGGGVGMPDQSGQQGMAA